MNSGHYRGSRLERQLSVFLPRKRTDRKRQLFRRIVNVPRVSQTDMSCRLVRITHPARRYGGGGRGVNLDGAAGRVDLVNPCAQPDSKA